jgi:hypothetical protein
MPLASTISLIALLMAALVYWIIRMIQAESAPKISIMDGFVVSGTGRNLKRIRISDIRIIEVAGLWDVAPADDCWILKGHSDSSMSFLSRRPGALVLLQDLQAILPGFSVKRAIETCRNLSIFEEPIEVWRKQGN